MSGESGAMAEGRDMRPRTIRVWDPAVRVFHWSLVAAMVYEFAFEAGTFMHDWVGYAVLALVAFRLLWGVIGTRHARFADFVKRPGSVIAYLFDIVAGHPRRYVGHNPAGGAMVVVLLAMLVLTAGSGWAMTTDALWGEDWIEALHETAANLTLVLIGLHVAGVLVASWQHRENLVLAMVTGRKPVHQGECISSASDR
jgi:cytochrome b